MRLLVKQTPLLKQRLQPTPNHSHLTTTLDSSKPRRTFLESSHETPSMKVKHHRR